MSTGTIGAAYLEDSTGEIIAMLSRFTNSASTFSFSARGTVRTLKNLGVASQSTFSFTFISGEAGCDFAGQFLISYLSNRDS